MKTCPVCDTRHIASDPTCRSCGATIAETASPVGVGDDATYHAELFAILERVEDEHFWFRSRNRLIQWAVGRYFPDAASLLEVGCGTGYVLAGLRARWPALELTGVELFTEGLDVARRRLPGVLLLQADARQLPFEEAFDVVTAFDVLEHIDDDAGVLGELFRAARPGGGVLVTVPQHRWLWSASDDAAAHRRRYSRVELERKLSATGFRPLRVTSFVSLLLPAMAAARLRSRRGGRYDFADEFRVGPRLNRALERVLTAERGLIRAGVSFPVGGSLLAAARKE